MSDNGWISVQDRLPEAFEDINICVRAGKKKYVRGAYRAGNNYKGIVTWYKSKHVTHWQPLPPPPEATP